MIVCPNCGKQLDDGAKFCDGCGEKIFRSVTCPSCGKQMDECIAFCQYCGAKIDAKQPVAAAVAASASEPALNSASAPAPMPVQTAVSAPVPEQTAASFVPMTQPNAFSPASAAVKKPFPTKAVLFGAIGLAVAALIVILIVIISGSGNALGNNFTVYAKNDGELYLNRFSGEPWQITKRLGAPSNGDIAEAAYQIGQCITVSKDGKTIFYPDKISGTANGMSLFYRGINSEDDGVRIDTSVTHYSVNDSAAVVTYIKAGDNNLYRYTLKTDEKNKIDSDVRYFYISDDGKRIVYCNYEGSVYSYNCDSDSKEKIDSDTSGIEYYSDDLTVLYYVKNNDLYKKVEGEDKVKIASDVQTVYKVYDSGEIYYTKLPESESISLIDYVEDDMKESDALITEPQYPDYPDYPDYPNYPSRPYRFRYDSQEEYEKALEEYNTAVENYEREFENYNNEVDKIREEYNNAVEKYYDDSEKYRAKTSRDYLRESLKSETLNYSAYTLCYYNGTEEKVLNGSFRSSSAWASDAAVIAYFSYKQDQLPSIKISEIQNTYVVSEMINNALFSETECYVAVKDSVNAFEGLVKTYNVIIDKSGEHLYYISCEEEKSEGNLYSAAVSDGAVQAPELYDTDVCCGLESLTLYNGKLAYWKEIDGDFYAGKGELYIDKERVDFDIQCSTVKYDSDSDAVTYITDIDSKGKGTLKIYKNSSAGKISDDVNCYSVLPNGKILYLYDYNTNRYRGELYAYSNGKTEKIDDDVVAVFQISDGKYKGY